MGSKPSSPHRNSSVLLFGLLKFCQYIKTAEGVAWPKLKSTHQSFPVLTKWIPVKIRRSRHVQKKLKVRKKKCPAPKNLRIHLVLCPVPKNLRIHIVLCPVLKSSMIHLTLLDPSRLSGKTSKSQVRK